MVFSPLPRRLALGATLLGLLWGRGGGRADHGRGGDVMSITKNEFEAMTADAEKRIEGDLVWRNDKDHSPAVELRARSEAGFPLFVCGRLNWLAGTLSYVLIHRGAGRVYGLDLGADHHNPTCNWVGEKHKHRWTEQFLEFSDHLVQDHFR